MGSKKKATKRKATKKKATKKKATKKTATKKTATKKTATKKTATKKTATKKKSATKSMAPASKAATPTTTPNSVSKAPQSTSSPDVFDAWFQRLFGVPCPVSAHERGALTQAMIPDYRGDEAATWFSVGVAAPPGERPGSEVWRSANLPDAIKAELRPPSLTWLDELNEKDPFLLVGTWSHGSFYWIQRTERLTASVRFPAGGAYASRERDLKQMGERIGCVARLLGEVPSGTTVQLVDDMGEGHVRVNHGGETWRGPLVWPSVADDVGLIVAGRGGETLLQPDSSPAAVFRAVRVAMTRIASAMRRHSPSCEVTLEPLDPPGTATPTSAEGIDAGDEDLDDDHIDEDLDEDLDDETAPIPDALLAACREVAGGAALRWSLTLKDGTVASGWLALPSEGFLLHNTTRTFMEGELGFSIAPSSRLEVCWPAESAGNDVYVFDADGMLIAETRVSDIFRQMVDSLGMPGWARGLTDARQAIVTRVKAELGLDVMNWAALFDETRSV